MGLKVNSRVKGLSRSIGEELLVPTRIYVKTVMRLLRKFPLHGIAHITGGGFTDNLPRIIPPGCKAVIDQGTWPIPPIFGVIQRGGNVSESEMFRTFNNGIGMVLAVPAREVKKILPALKAMKEKAFWIGEIARAGKREGAVEYR
jgi:phosphoribosylformylglycinamidine cyclo-ligase